MPIKKCVVKREDLQHVFHQLNSFHPNIKFTADDFSDGNVHFLDLLIDKNTTDIYHEDTHTARIFALADHFVTSRGFKDTIHNCDTN